MCRLFIVICSGGSSPEPGAMASPVGGLTIFFASILILGGPITKPTAYDGPREY